jgi:hypothetical protein
MLEKWFVGLYLDSARLRARPAIAVPCVALEALLDSAVTDQRVGNQKRGPRVFRHRAARSYSCPKSRASSWGGSASSMRPREKQPPPARGLSCKLPMDMDVSGVGRSR